jgi:Flp pilus assembly pilin Flp
MINILHHTITAAQRAGAYITALVAFVLGAAPVPALARVNSRRGATFIEYALLAAVALVVFVLFRTQLSSMFTSLLERLRVALS